MNNCEQCIRTAAAINELVADYGDVLLITKVTGKPKAKGLCCAAIIDADNLFDHLNLVERLESAVARKRGKAN